MFVSNEEIVGADPEGNKVGVRFTFGKWSTYIQFPGGRAWAGDSRDRDQALEKAKDLCAGSKPKNRRI